MDGIVAPRSGPSTRISRRATALQPSRYTLLAFTDNVPIPKMHLLENTHFSLPSTLLLLLVPSKLADILAKLLPLNLTLFKFMQE